MVAVTLARGLPSPSTHSSTVVPPSLGRFHISALMVCLSEFWGVTRNSFRQ